MHPTPCICFLNPFFVLFSTHTTHHRSPVVIPCHSWKQCPDSSRKLAPVTWAEAQFTLSSADANSTLVLDIGSNNGNFRGHFYLNGVDLGRVWGIAQGGASVQQYYYLPVDVVRSHLNRLTVVSLLPAAFQLPLFNPTLQVMEQGGTLDDLQIMRVSMPS